MIAFIVCFIVALVILVALAAYGQHMGNPDPIDWVTLVVVALLLGLVCSGLWTGLVEATRVVTGVLS